MPKAKKGSTKSKRDGAASRKLNCVCCQKKLRALGNLCRICQSRLTIILTSKDDE